MSDEEQRLNQLDADLLVLIQNGYITFDENQRFDITTAGRLEINPESAA